MGVGLVQGQASIGVHVKSGAMGEVSFSMGRVSFSMLGCQGLREE